MYFTFPAVKGLDLSAIHLNPIADTSIVLVGEKALTVKVSICSHIYTPPTLCITGFLSPPEKCTISQGGDTI